MKSYLQTRIQALEKTQEFNKPNLDLITHYIQYRKNIGFSEATILNDVKALIAFSKSIKDKSITDLTPNDMYSFFDSISKTKASAILYRSKIALFLRFINRDDLADLCKIRIPQNTKKLPEDMLSQDEIDKLITATHNLRDAAFIALLYESGARRGELIELQTKHIVFDEYGAVITLPKGKTGPRRIRVVFSASYLHNWLNHYPLPTNPNNYLWISLKDPSKLAGYTTLRDMLQRTAKKAGITKPVNMHNFRHSRATHLANDLTEQQLKIYLGWTHASSMAARYVHLSGKDVDPAILKLNGLEVQKEERPASLKIIKCPRCKELQNRTSKYCLNCGLPLNEDISATLTEKQDLIQDLNAMRAEMELIKTALSSMSPETLFNFISKAKENSKK